jgi:hypothetical protein
MRIRIRDKEEEKLKHVAATHLPSTPRSPTRSLIASLAENHGFRAA